jgi:DNA-binding NarL/FixJ family response regulator
VLKVGLMSPLLTAAVGEHAGLPIRIFLVDDSAEFLESAARFLATDPTIAVVGRALTATEALEQLGLLQPDLVLVDLTMPGLSGIELASLVKARPNPPRVIVLTLYSITEYAAAAGAANADGCVAKSMFGTRLLPLIHALFARPAV